MIAWRASPMSAPFASEPRNFDVQNAYAVFLCKQKDFEGAKKHPQHWPSIPRTTTQKSPDERRNLHGGQARPARRGAVLSPGARSQAGLQRRAAADVPVKFRQEDYMNARAFPQRFMSDRSKRRACCILLLQIEEKLGNDRGRRNTSTSCCGTRVSGIGPGKAGDGTGKHERRDGQAERRHRGGAARRDRRRAPGGRASRAADLRAGDRQGAASRRAASPRWRATTSRRSAPRYLRKAT